MSASPAQALSVGELTRSLKRLIEEGFPAVWVRGEVSNLRRQASGHCYFSLKDPSSQIPAVLFRGNALRIDHRLGDGQQVIAFGELSVYEPRGAYQLIVRDLVEDGIGRLQRELERLKEKLRAEGLFDESRKKPLPDLPLTVGVITSASGAAVRDMISVFRRRGWGGNLRIFPCLVQGAPAVPALAEQIERAGRMKDLEVLVLARGGGSIEDLWCFNEERVARALAACPLPTISAIGHETDVVLTDFVADLRKETPTGAAEWISSAFVEARLGVRRMAADFFRAGALALESRLADLNRLRSRSASRPLLRRIENDCQRLDDARERMVREIDRTARERIRAIAALRERLSLRRPDREWVRRRGEVQSLGRRLAASVGWQNKRRKDALDQLVRTLRTGGLDGTLRRGFVLVEDAAGRPVPRVASLRPNQEVSLRFHDGAARVRVSDQNGSPGTPLDPGPSGA